MLTPVLSNLHLWFNNAFRPTSVVQQRLHLALCNDIGFYTTERHVL